MAQAENFNPAKELKGLIGRAGFSSQEAFAQAAGYSRQSSVQRYLDEKQWDNKPLPLDFVQKAKDALDGKGRPPITPREIWRLAGLGEDTPLDDGQGGPPVPNDDIRVNHGLPILYAQGLPKDVRVLGTAACGEGGGDFTLNGEIVDYARRPPSIANNRSVFAIYAVGDSMSPWREPGDLVYINPNRAPKPGDYVLVELTGKGHGENGAALLKKLVAVKASHVLLAQFNPPRADIKIPRSQIKSILRVMDWSELLGV